VKALGDENLRIITRALVECVRENASIDWTERESVRANLRRMVRRILRRYGYPPDKQAVAVQHIIAQAEALTAQMVA
jgi:type I restriction enzyme R subunit